MPFLFENDALPFPNQPFSPLFPSFPPFNLYLHFNLKSSPRHGTAIAVPIAPIFTTSAPKKCHKWHFFGIEIPDFAQKRPFLRRIFAIYGTFSE